MCHVTSLLVGRHAIGWLELIRCGVLLWYLNMQMRSILRIHKPHYRQRSRVCKAGTGITEDVSSEERTSEPPGRWKTRDLLRDCSEGHAIGWLEMTSVFTFFVWYFTGNFTVHKTPLLTTGRVCKAETVVTVDVSSEERTSDLPGRWKHVTCFVISRKDMRLADWIWRQRSRSFELAGRLML